MDLAGQLGGDVRCFHQPIYLRGWRLNRRQLRVPVAEKLLRAPGESLPKRLEELDDQLSEQLAMLVTGPLLYVGALMLERGSVALTVGSVTVMAFVGLAIYAYFVRGFFRLLQERRRYRLGLGGELAVGEELNRLMLEGVQVFHDVPCLYGNVDHVLVASCGVCAIETKTRRKKPVTDERTQRVVYDGRTVRFGVDGREETKCLEQAGRQADHLSDWLSKAVGEPVRARPVLALPGWYVDRRERGEVAVVSSREVHKLIKGESVLGLGMIQRIAHQLDARCRDAEF